MNNIKAKKAKFDIHVANQVIHAHLYGRWGGAIDLFYLSEMNVKMHEVRALPWAIFIDLTECEFTQQIFNDDIRHNSGLDRRNQLIECWLLREPEQISFLEHFPKEQDVILGKFTNEKESAAWMMKKGFVLDTDWLTEIKKPESTIRR